MEKIKLSKCLDEKLVIFLDVNERDDALKSLVKVANASGKIDDEEKFLSAILQREDVVSTCIGMGVAIPHAKMASFNQFFVVIGILNDGVDWKAIDDSKVRIIFMIGGPDDKQTEYLQILSKLTQAIKNNEIRKKMLTLKSPKDIITLFKDV